MKVIRLKEVMALTGLSKSSIYRFSESNDFPKSVPLGARSVGWIESEVNQWLERKISSREQEKRSA
ncbi:AlpA family transcriptional regulator [Vibrio vulnificus]|uniref:AlpA family transcriptional regulator n=1 Tax=Vibrio vulnificus TaxID=672 RepID=UPI00102A50F8|nr:AlpA family transcriptional regulator [Vibrio vulnificus]RZQ02769.1 AlpA family transcriptional regulator [Vibrio vulnificus]